MENLPHAIEVDRLVKRYGSQVAVNQISFTVGRGEIVGFLGPNGAGKSTTMRILTGYLPATSGSATVCGYPVAAQPVEVKSRIGYMPENNPLPEDLRVVEYLRWRGRLKGVPRRRLRRRIDEVLEVCDLTRARRRIIGKLSKGFRQRVGIADAILSEPEVIIMDEPTIGLDPHQIVMIRDLIAGFRGRMTVILSSHILPEIEMTCDRVIIINAGRIVATGSPDELRREFIGSLAFDLELAGPTPSLRDALLPLDPALRIEAGEPSENGSFRTVRIQTSHGPEFGEAIIKAVTTRADLRLRSLTRRTASLEEVFLAATRRSWETELPLPAAPPSPSNPTPDEPSPEPAAAAESPTAAPDRDPPGASDQSRPSP
ncbi:MAG: ABC transporter ATP-binding protein [Puniceicoccaceae bacterium]|nr:MAG: ABC transporter ATP-binding protein [Puniceicoccaceae bacterium]